MKRLVNTLFIVGLVLTVLASCGGTNLDVEVEETPKYKDGVAFPMVLSITDDDGPAADLKIDATLEMKRMDHGIIDVNFSDEGDGTYLGEVELPMAGEWIANLELTQDGNTSEKIVTFDVEEE